MGGLPARVERSPSSDPRKKGRPPAFPPSSLRSSRVFHPAGAALLFSTPRALSLNPIEAGARYAWTTIGRSKRLSSCPA